MSAQGPRHLPGLDDANVVRTKTTAFAELNLASAIDRNGIAVVHGAPGNGKTFTVDQFLDRHRVPGGRPVHWLDMPPAPAPKEVTVRLLSAIGVPHRTRDSQFELTDQLVPELTGRIVVIDEAQNLRQASLQQVRYLHDMGRASWALVLVGSTVDEAMNRAPELGSRVSARIQFAPLEDQALLRAIRAWHPLMETIEPKFLLQLDSTYGYGNWRRWGQLLSALLDLMKQLPTGTTVTPKHLSAALAMVQG